MKTYCVTLYFHTSIDVQVEATDKRQAIEYAREKWGKDPQIVQNMQEDDDPDVVVWDNKLKDYKAI